jgi:hypothetical protein
MNTREQGVEQFFHAFERSSDAGDIPMLLTQFAETFMAAGPQGTQCVRAADFAVALPKRKKFVDDLGCESTSLAALEQTWLDGRFVLAKTRWRMRFVQAEGARDVLADSVFLVDTSGAAMRIVLYLAQQDLTTMLREHGILPN